MFPGLQRRLFRLFPQGSETLWLDGRHGFWPSGMSFPVAVIGLDFLFAAEKGAPLPGQALVLDMDGGADVDDALRAGADGVLCSPAQSWECLAVLARQCRRWDCPCIVDGRKASAESLRRLAGLGIHAALLTAGQAGHTPFQHFTTRLRPGMPADFHP